MRASKFVTRCCVLVLRVAIHAKKPSAPVTRVPSIHTTQSGIGWGVVLYVPAEVTGGAVGAR